MSYNETGICVVWGKEFRKKNPKHKTCSPECSYKWHKQVAKQCANKRQKGLPKIECSYCGKKFTPNSPVQRYCCRSCASLGSAAERRAKMPKRNTEESFWCKINHTPGCDGPMSAAYSPLEQHMGAM